jgi:AsmA protein
METLWRRWPTGSRLLSMTASPAGFSIPDFHRMSRRAVLSIAIVCLLLLVSAAIPWTLSSGGLAANVTAHLKSRYGVELTVAGRSTFALLPTPRIKFEQIALRQPATSIAAEGGILRAEINILPLLWGRIELDAVSLTETRISASTAALRSRDWATLLADVSRNVRINRLVLAGSSLRLLDRPQDGLAKINAVFAWAGDDDTLSVVGSAAWRGETIAVERLQLQPLALASGRPGNLAVTAMLHAAHITVEGVAQAGTDPNFKGTSLLKATSVRNFTRWSGLDLPFGSLLRAVSIEGPLSFDRRGLSWPTVAVKLGGGVLEGTLAARLDGERPLITGTLAADEVDLSDLVTPLAQAMTSSGTWSDEAIDLTRTTGSDLDLRLSASDAQFARVRLGDMAASVQVRPGRIEASLGRGTFHDGTLKGRLSLVTVEGGTEMRVQGAFDQVDMASFLTATGQGRWLQGPGQGQFHVEGIGRTPAELVRHAAGDTQVTIKDGELIGIGLSDAVRRIEKRPLAASLNWKGGRTPFAQAQVRFNVVDGIAEIADSRLVAPGVVTSLHGKISLVERMLNLKADVSPATTSPSPAPAIVFDVTGRWQDVVITPDARSFIQRSGAAKPLFGPSHPLATGAGSLATAQ